jgi:hypothetical protein
VNACDEYNLSDTVVLHKLPLSSYHNIEHSYSGERLELQLYGTQLIMCLVCNFQWKEGRIQKKIDSRHTNDEYQITSYFLLCEDLIVHSLMWKHQMMKNSLQLESLMTISVTVYALAQHYLRSAPTKEVDEPTSVEHLATPVLALV